MKYYLTSFGLSALFHAGVLLAAMPLALWQDKLGQVEEPQPVTLSLAQFIPAPPPEPVVAPPEEPESVPEPPKPEPKPPEKPKPKPEKKAVGKHKPKPKPKQAVKPQTVSRAAPQSPKPQAHTSAQSAKSDPQTAPPAQAASNKAAEAAYKARLQNLIAARKQYPRMAERAEVEGSVVVAFTVMPNGTISGARISRSSGNEWLDKAAIQAVNAASGALPFPPEIRKPQWAFSLTVNFRLD